MPFRIEIACHFTDQDAIYGLGNPPGDSFVAKIGDAVGATAAADETETAEALRGRIEDHLQAADPQFTVTQGTGTNYTIAKNDAFTLYLASFQSFAEFIGLPTSTEASVTSVVGEQAPSIFEGERAAVVTTGWRWQLRRTEVNHGEARSVKLLKQQIYQVRVQVTRAEVNQWQATARYMLLGLPFTLYTELDPSVNGFNMVGYGQGNLGGKIYMRLDAADNTLSATQLTDPYQSDVSVEFNAIDVSTTGGALTIP